MKECDFLTPKTAQVREGLLWNVWGQGQLCLSRDLPPDHRAEPPQRLRGREGGPVLPLALPSPRLRAPWTGGWKLDLRASWSQGEQGVPSR